MGRITVRKVIYSVVCNTKDGQELVFNDIAKATAGVHGNLYEFCYKGSDVLQHVDLRDLASVPVITRSWA